MREVLADDVTDLLIREITCSDEESLACHLWNLYCLNMGLSDVAYTNPNVNAGIGDLVLEFTESRIAYTLIGGVQIVERVEVVGLGSVREVRVKKVEEWHTTGPNTMGGFIVEIVKFGFFFSTKSHAAFSANVLLALWTVSGRARSNLIGAYPGNRLLGSPSPAPV